MPARHQFPSHSLTFIFLVFDGGGGEGDLHCTSSSVVQCSPQQMAVHLVVGSRTLGGSSQKDVVFNAPHNHGCQVEVFV